MRIACIYLPSLPLQVFLRGAPQVIGAPVAVVGTVRPQASPTVVACSRAAWNLGVRPGLSALAAVELIPGLVIAPDDDATERAAVHAVAEALLGITSIVDAGVDIGRGPAGAHHAIYVAVPARTRGASFGARLVEAVEAQGFRARVGIADDRFTAWVAASSHAEADAAGRVVTVPRGGSAAFLAPLPLSLLAISPEVQHVLATVGVRTLGEFAALPPPSVTHAWDADYQALARGDGGAGLIGFVPSGPVIERVAVGGEIGVGAALGLVARRVAARLRGRGLAAVAVAVRTGARLVEVNLPMVSADERDLSDVIGRALHEGGAASFVELEVTGQVVADGLEVGTSTAPPLVEAIPTPVLAESSGPVVTPVFQLTAPAAMGMGPREAHHRTRRGKQRSRVVTASAQSRLFSR